jgi:hypothetical protein
MLATGLLLMGSASASAQNTELKSHSTTVRPPVYSNARFTCGEGGAEVVAKLSNPNATVQDYMVGIHAGDIYYNYVVTVSAHGSESVEFGGLPNDTYQLQAQNAAGDVVARARVRVKCDVKPPTSPPTGTPTGTPTVSPSETPTTPATSPTSSPTTGTSSVPTAVPSTPVAVPTAVEAGLSGPVAQDDSSHGGTIVGAGLLAAVGIMIGLASLLVRRRRGLHQR